MRVPNGRHTIGRLVSHSFIVQYHQYYSHYSYIVLRCDGAIVSASVLCWCFTLQYNQLLLPLNGHNRHLYVCMDELDELAANTSHM